MSESCRALALALLLALPAALAAQVSERTASGGPGALQAEIRTTSYGVPHILAKDYAGAGFGYGYALAKADICEFAGRWVTVRAQRSRYFGPESTESRGSGLPIDPGNNLASDFFWQRLLDLDVVGKELNQAAPLGPTREVRELVRGYVAGYNHYLAEVGVDKLPDARCRGAEWVQPITERDVYLRALYWNIYLSSGSLVTQFVRAASPTAGSASQSTASEQVATAAQSAGLEGGSNAIAVGGDLSDNGQGMVFANPHWFWDGADRFYEAHLTIPGELNVYGSGFSGFPVIVFGHTQNVAWSHTASTPRRYTVYELKLAKGSPTSYLYEGKVRKMRPRTVSVEAKSATGQLEKRSHTFWETHYGLVLENDEYVWNTRTAYAVRDVATSFRWLNQQLAMNQAQSVEEMDAAGRKYLGIGWLNTFSADAKGRAQYADRTAVPHVTNEQLKACVSSEFGRKVLARERLPVMDGWRSQCEWGADEHTPLPGIFGPSSLPQLARSDYVANSNDSYWVNHLSAKLEGFPTIMGAERIAQSLRTRNGLAKLERRKAGRDGYPGNTFSLDLFERITMDNRVFSAELWRDDAVAMCRGLSADAVGEACEVLAKWDLTENLDSAGAVLWRRFLERLCPSELENFKATLFATPFDPNDPLNTPRGLNTKLPVVSEAFTAAIADLRTSGVPLDATYRKYHIEERAGHSYPIPGGPHRGGQYNEIINKAGWVAGKGWPDITLGSGFIMWMQFTPQGPVGRSILAYSQSNNPESKHYTDQLQLFSEGRSKPILFTESAIRADSNLESKKLCTPVESAQCKRFLQ